MKEMNDIETYKEIGEESVHFPQELSPEERGLHYMNDIRRLDDEICLLARYISDLNYQLDSLNSDITSLSNINPRESSEEYELNDLIKIYSEKQNTSDELERILEDAQERKQAIVSGNHVQGTRISCVSKALLDPRKYDNIELWKLLHEKNIFEMDTVLKSAEEIGFNHISNVPYCLNGFCPNTRVFYPDLSLFIQKLEMKCINSTVIIEQIIASCLDLKEQQTLRFIYLNTHPSHFSDSATSYSFLYNDYVPDDSLFDHVAYIGSVNNPFIEQFKCILNDQFDEDISNELEKPLGDQPNNVVNNEIFTSDMTMQILGLFINVAGIATIAIAFTVLNAATLGIPGVAVACVGIATTLGGFGLFKYAYDRSDSDCKKIQFSPD